MLKDTLLILLLISIPLVVGIVCIVLLIHLGRKRREREKQKSSAQHYTAMTRELRGWGITLIVINAAGLLVSLNSSDPRIQAAAIAGFLTALIIGRLFLTIQDAVLFLMYGVILAFFGLFDLLALGLFGLPFAALRIIIGFSFVRTYRRYRPHQAAYWEANGVTLTGVRQGFGISRKLSRITLVTGVASGVGVGVLFYLEIFAVLIGQTIEVPFLVVIVDQFLVLLGIVAAALTVGLRVEKMDTGGFSTVAGIMGGVAAMFVLGLNLLAGQQNYGQIDVDAPEISAAELRATQYILHPLPTRTPPPTLPPSWTPVPSPTPPPFAGASTQFRLPLEVAQSRAFGYSVAVYGSDLLVGAPSFVSTQPGRATLYTNTDDGTWRKVADLEAVSPSAGTAVGLDDRAAVLGGERSFYVFDRSQSEEWQRYGPFKPPENNTLLIGLAQFGRVFDISGDWIAMGEPEAHIETDYYNHYGTVYLYHRDEAGTWSEHSRLTSPDGRLFEFGFDVEIEGELLAVASRDGDLGKVTLFMLQDGGWAVLNELWFYQPIQSMDLDGTTLAVAFDTFTGGEIKIFRYLNPTEPEVIAIPEPDNSQIVGTELELAGDILVTSVTLGPEGPYGLPMIYVYHADPTVPGGWVLWQMFSYPVELEGQVREFGRDLALGSMGLVVSGFEPVRTPDADQQRGGPIFFPLNDVPYLGGTLVPTLTPTPWR